MPNIGCHFLLIFFLVTNLFLVTTLLVIGITIIFVIFFVLAWARFSNDTNGPVKSTPGIFSGLGFGGWSRSLPVWQENLLRREFLFYNGLGIKDKRKFGHRLLRFMANKKFEGRHEVEVTATMKVLISATAVRVTFGLRSYLLPSFHTILIFPEPFYSRVSGRKVKGETLGLGVVAFSWKDLLFGISDMNDNLNLGYHEFAHALFIERFRNTIDAPFIEHYDAWRLMVLQEQKLAEAEEKNTFRPYATYNEHEFFAVSVENFFERPEKFRQDLPKLYKLMIRMMGQDPLASSGGNSGRYSFFPFFPLNISKTR